MKLLKMVEIELMSFHLPQHSTSTTSTNTLNYLTNKYLLLNINN